MRESQLVFGKVRRLSFNDLKQEVTKFSLKSPSSFGRNKNKEKKNTIISSKD
jgi:hypothetical protein